MSTFLHISESFFRLFYLGLGTGRSSDPTPLPTKDFISIVRRVNLNMIVFRKYRPGI